MFKSNDKVKKLICINCVLVIRRYTKMLATWDATIIWWLGGTTNRPCDRNRVVAALVIMRYKAFGQNEPFYVNTVLQTVFI